MYPLIEAEKEVISLFETALSQKNIHLTSNSYNELLNSGELAKRLEIPPDNMGDFAVPCAFLVPVLRKSPNDIAKDIAKNRSSVILGNQLIRSGTSVSLNYGEAQSAESRKDFVHNTI